ncbi:lactonase family protein [Parasediminibacterium paludis]|uniref:Lactonase family protein n=1 Tax=Parasediminibacterium paludis TaxID=908966 RepID=A0ABV8PRF7_9BACT
MRIIVTSLLLFIVTTVFSQSSYYLFVGGYTTGKNEGISVYTFNTVNGSVQFVSKIASDNPSYLAIGAKGKYLYSANEASKVRPGSASAFRFNKKSGKLTLLNQVLVGGDGPCYVSVDKANKWLVTANYGSGSVSVLNLKKDGAIDTLKQLFQHTGSSVNVQRQKEPHAHMAIFSPDEKLLFTNDLGNDRINIYNFNNANRSTPFTAAADSVIFSVVGNGPRHTAFHPSLKLLYVINELSGTIDVFNYQNGIQNVQTISTDTSNNLDKGSADIHFSPDGKFLYATNRGNYNNIVIYSVDAINGTLTYIGLEPTRGKTPRNFTIDPTGHYLLVANQNSDNVIIFKRDKTTGLLTFVNQFETGNPTCLKLLAIE